MQTNRGHEAERVATTIVTVAQPSAPSSLVVATSGGDAKAAIEAIAAGWAFIGLPETGTSRPASLRLFHYAKSDSSAGNASVETIYGVRPGPDGAGVVLEPICDVTYTFGTATADIPASGGVPACFSASAAALVAAAQGTELGVRTLVNAARPAGIEIGVLSRWCGFARRMGKGTATGIYHGHQRLWDEVTV